MKERIKLKRNLCVFKSNDHETSEMWQEQAKQSKPEITERERKTEEQAAIDKRKDRNRRRRKKAKRNTLQARRMTNKEADPMKVE